MILIVKIMGMRVGLQCVRRALWVARARVVGRRKFKLHQGRGRVSNTNVVFCAENVPLGGDNGLKVEDRERNVTPHHHFTGIRGMCCYEDVVGLNFGQRGLFL